MKGENYVCTKYAQLPSNLVGVAPNDSLCRHLAISCSILPLWDLDTLVTNLRRATSSEKPATRAARAPYDFRLIREYLLSTSNEKQASYTNYIEDEHNKRVDAQGANLAGGAEDETIDVDGGEQDAEAGEVDVCVFCLREN